MPHFQINYCNKKQDPVSLLAVRSFQLHCRPSPRLTPPSKLTWFLKLFVSLRNTVLLCLEDDGPLGTLIVSCLGR